MAGFKNWREFSWASSVTEATFSKWKSGENKPSRESLQLVVAALRNAGLDTSIQALEVRAGLATDPIGEEAPKTVPPQIAKLLAIWDRSPTQEFRNELIGYVENVSELFAAKLEKLEAAADYRSLSA